MNERSRELLVEETTNAWRASDPRGGLRASPAWHDLDELGRVEAFQAAVVQRAIEQALDVEGLSSTARAVLARIERSS